MWRCPRHGVLSCRPCFHAVRPRSRRSGQAGRRTRATLTRSNPKTASGAGSSRAEYPWRRANDLPAAGWPKDRPPARWGVPDTSRPSCDDCRRRVCLVRCGSVRISFRFASRTAGTSRYFGSVKARLGWRRTNVALWGVAVCPCRPLSASGSERGPIHGHKGFPSFAPAVWTCPVTGRAPGAIR